MLAAAFALGIVVFVVPKTASAFWLFSALAPSAEANSSSSIVPDNTLSVLAAAVNSDPNPSKGGNTLALTTGSALIADQGPEGTPDIETAPKNGAISLYVVRPGDTLSEIADMYGVSQNTILWANDLKSATDIHPGDSLIILPVTGIEHTIVKGETLASLATKYGGNASDIASFNGLDAGAALTPGSTVIIPGGELSSASKSSSGSKSSSSRSGVKQGGSLSSVQSNPYRGGSGAPLPGYYSNPLPGGIITQGIPGWNGVDIGAKTGTPIYAAAAGTVIVSKANGGWNGGYGDYVVVSHPNGTQTLYAHMSRVAASMGQGVAAGALLGYVGATGDATGPHLHFEVRGAANPFRNCAVGRACSPQ
jgi:LysM repeat protein